MWRARFEAEDRGYSYRTFRGDWSSTPKDWDPSLVVKGDTAYVSWNGATDEQERNVYVNEGLRGRVRRAGFEAMVRLEGARRPRFCPHGCCVGWIGSQDG